MPPNPEIRASDADRDRVAAALREHCAQGRITMDELYERLEATYAAKTLGDLQKVTADLPEIDLYELPVPASQHGGPPVPRSRSGLARHHGLHGHWRGYATANLICITVWVVSCVSTGALLFPWWIWLAGPWGALLLARMLFGDRRD